MAHASKRIISLRDVQQFRVSQCGGATSAAGLQLSSLGHGVDRLFADSKQERQAILDPMKNFGESIRDLRLAQDFGLRETATKVGISPAYLSRIERGKEGPPWPEVIKKLAKVLAAEGIKGNIH